MSAPLVLRAGDARVAVDLAEGGRLSSLTVGGLELLGTGGPAALDWGCFVMAPYAGRVRNARLTYAGSRYKLPVGERPHAIHGLTYDRPWTVVERRGAAELALQCELDERWPFRGTVMHRMALSSLQLELGLTLTATDAPFPATIGWHPWFRRRLDYGRPVEIDLRAGGMLAKDGAGMATNARVPIAEGPWDDAFVEVDWPVGLSWPGAMHLDVWSDAAVAVVFDAKDAAVCVEPQTGPPNGINTVPTIVAPDRPLVSRLTLTWVTG